MTTATHAGSGVIGITGHLPQSFRAFLVQHPESYAHLLEDYQPR